MNFFSKRSLQDYLNSTKDIKIKGFRFTIKKIDVLDYLANDSVLLKLHDIYKNNKTIGIESHKNYIPKIKEHYKQVINAGLVKPKVSYKEEGEGIYIEEFFQDWDLAEKLYAEIILFTTGKKKFKQNMFQEKNV